MPVTFNHAGIVVSDLDRSLKFYCEGLGLHANVVMEGEGEALSHWLGYPNVKVRFAFLSGVDGGSIELVEYRRPKGEKRSAAEMHKRAAVGAGHLAFIVDNVDRTWKKLLSLGGKPLNPPIAFTSKLRGLYMQDPDGNWVELDEDKAHKKQPFRIVQNTAFLTAKPPRTKTKL